MNMKDFLKEKKQLIQEKKKEKEELQEQANYNVYSWYQLYKNNSRACAVGFIMPDNYEIHTSTSTYRHDSAAQFLFAKYFSKDLQKEEIEEDITWFNLLPKYYNTICFELVSPLYNTAGSDILIFLPDKINEFQKEILYKIQNEMDFYNENIKVKVKYHAGFKKNEDDFERIDDMLDAYYKLDRINERSEYYGKL